MIKKLLFATWVLLLLQTAFMGTAMAQEPLTISISPSKEVYSLGEDIVLEVVVHNPNDEEVKVMWLFSFEEINEWSPGQFYGRESIPAHGYYGKNYKISSKKVGMHTVHASLYDLEFNLMDEGGAQLYVEEREITFGKSVAIPIILVSIIAVIVYKKRVRIKVIISDRRRRGKKSKRRRKKSR